MKSAWFWCAFLANLISADCSVTFQPRYAHEAEPLSVGRALGANVEIVKRVRSQDFIPSLERRADNSTKLGSFDLDVQVPSDPLFSVYVGSASPTKCKCFLTAYIAL